MKKILLLTLAIMLLAVGSASGQACFITAMADDQISNPSQMSSENYIAPPPRPNQLKDFATPFQFGKSFNEVGLTAGGIIGLNGKMPAETLAFLVRSLCMNQEALMITSGRR